MTKKVQASAKQERKGVAAVQQIVTTDLEWIFREQPTDDYGIDAQIEIVEAGAATGRLLAAQIKSGLSYFKQADDEGWWYPLDKDDLEYWLDHALPVIVILCDTDSGLAYWELVAAAKLVTGKRGGVKILVPREQLLGSASRRELGRAAEGRPYDLRVRQLRLALPWMKLLQSGRRILLEADEWVNKTSGRGDIKIVSVDDANADRVELSSWFIMAGLRPYAEVLAQLVPWADVSHHEETYDQADYDAWEGESVYYDNEGDRIVSVSYEDWLGGRNYDGLRPYANSIGEVDHWRLELTLNELGRGFLAMNEFAERDGWILTPSTSGSKD